MTEIVWEIFGVEMARNFSKAHYTNIYLTVFKNV